MNSTVFSSMIATVKSEPDCISDQIEQKVKYEQEIIQLRKMYDEQIYKLRNELEKSKQSSLLLHSDLSRQDEFSSNENLKTKNMELMVENKVQEGQNWSSLNFLNFLASSCSVFHADSEYV